MDPHAALPQPAIDALARGWTVLTANQRAARSLRRAFDLRQTALGLTHWRPPAILAWNSWLSSLWHGLLLEGYRDELLLNATQEHSLWRDIIAADPGASTLRPRDSLAELSADAWSRLHAFRASRRLHASANTADTRAFVRWAREFERLCLQSRYITAAQLAETLAAAVSAGNLPLPSGLLLIGFDSVSPADAALLDAAVAAGVALQQPRPPYDSTDRSAGPPILVQASDLNGELLACAQWLRDRLTEEPQARLAVIVPDIAAERSAIDRALRNVLTPRLSGIEPAAGSSPFEFSLGIPLARTPLAAAALDTLSWAAGPLPLDRVSALLLSPHLAATPDPDRVPHDELLARAEFDAFTLRRRSLLEPRIGIDEFGLLLFRSQQADRLPVLRAQLRTLSAAVRDARLERDRSCADWAAALQGILDAAGWAPPAALDSIEFQTRHKWQGALDELATLDFQPRAAGISLRTALDALTRIAGQTLFAPESRHAPVQIMGPLEAAGSTFHALWFLRAADLSWPSNPSPNPLLPYPLQRELAMPGADTLHDTARSLRITQRIAASAPVVVFSYARQTPSGHQRLSPILADLGLEITPELVPPDPPPVPVRLDSLLDDTPIAAPPPGSLRGGASILEAQAACSFRAFAERRLFSTALDQVSLGLDARERGSVVHHVLHQFWAQVRTQAALRLMPSADRDTLLEQSIASALSRARAATGWGNAYLDAERERLLRLLRPWLEFEATQRAPFTVKAAEEKREGVAIGPLHLDVRVDRIDETVPAQPGELPAEIILDYKTGRAETAQWQGPRPDSPQLPLYAVVSPSPRLAAVAFASIRPGKFMALSGYQSQPGILPAPKKGQTRDLAAQRDQWRDVLTTLAQEFHAGRALASPKSYPGTCAYCGQRLFCRLDLAMLTSAETAEPDDPSEPSAISIHGREEPA